ncbi:hypothetical protein [Pseudomonas poae]
MQSREPPIWGLPLQAYLRQSNRRQERLVL